MTSLVVFGALLSLATPPTAPPAPPTPPTPPPSLPAPPSTPSKDPRVARAQAAAEALRQQLLTAVQGAIAARGVAGAVDVCHATAPALTAAASTPTLTIGRTSARLRNTDNAPRAWVQPLLDDLVKARVDERGPRTVVLDDGALGVVLPIAAGKLCLQCHGVDVAADVKAAIAARYPKDEATGFREGDLRGVFWVEVR
jgi:hypothetical protein